MIFFNVNQYDINLQS